MEDSVCLPSKLNEIKLFHTSNHKLHITFLHKVYKKYVGLLPQNITYILDHW